MQKRLLKIRDANVIFSVEGIFPRAFIILALQDYEIKMLGCLGSITKSLMHQ